MRISNWDGTEQSIASIGELLTTDFVELLRKGCFTEELTNDALRKAFKMYAYEDDGTMDLG